MRDDDFDRDLARRLQHYEGSVPDAHPAKAGSSHPGRAFGWLVVGVGGAAVVAAVLLAIVLLQPPQQNVGDTTPVPSASSPTPEAPAPSPSPSEPSPSATATAVPATPVPPPASVELGWTRTASYPSSGGLSMVDHVVRVGDGYVAVGVEFEQPLPVYGPTPPHHARAWTSVDGRSWEPVDLGPGFENVRLGHLIHGADGSLLALGERGVVGEFGIIETEPAAWTSADGMTWSEIEPPLEGSVVNVEQGPKGVLAVVRPSISTDDHEFWLSPDGESWEVVHSLESAYVDIGAGDEGFAAVGWIGDQDGSPFAIASADGREWIEGPTPPFGEYLEVASHGPDWVVVDDPGGIAPTWFSANGLDWTAHGEVPLRTIKSDGTQCREYRSQLTSSRPWLVTTSELAYPCSESGFMVHGTQYLSADGAAWVAIPLAEGTPGQSRSGSSVRGALATEGGLILVGEENAAATFWFGEAP